ETAVPVPARYGVMYIGRGKQDKLSKADVLGFLCKKGGLKAAQIGRIDVGPHYAYAAVLRSQLRQLLRRIAGEKIKGMRTLVEEMRK
ncbi:DbpA RNA binding domain-containing protein, partial [bacterium]|nr:DbpA RNA binding domain-containing protein [bacterium]